MVKSGQKSGLKVVRKVGFLQKCLKSGYFWGKNWSVGHFCDQFSDQKWAEKSTRK